MILKKNFFELINISDLCITRAGATSLAEISFLNKPFIAIPLPTSADSHQMKMQNIMKKRMLLDYRSKILNKDKLSNFIKNLLKNKNDLMNKKMNLKKLNNENSREFIYQKLKRVINEN